MKVLEKLFKKFANKMIWVMIGVYVTVFTAICFLKYQSFGYYDWDFASDVIVLWNSVHGKLLYYPFLEQNIWGAHFYLIVLLLIPFYAIFQQPLFLLFLQSLFLGLAAFPLYLLARIKLNKTWSLCISLAYLLYPSVGFINLFETHFEIYEIFFIFFALYYFEKEKFKKYLVFIFLTLACKENAALIVFMLGIYAGLRKKSKRWILVPCLISVIWFFVAIRLVIPYFAKYAKLYAGGFMFTVYYQHLGKNIFEMAKNVLLHPIIFLNFALTPPKFLYLIQLFIPLGFLSLLSPAILFIAFPIFMQNLLSSVATHHQIYYQYVALLIPFIFYAAIISLHKLLIHKTLLRWEKVLIIVFLTIVISASIFLGSPQTSMFKFFRAYRLDVEAVNKAALVKSMPLDAAVMASFQFLPHLANRANLYSAHFLSTGFKMYTSSKYQPPEELDYFLIDFNEPLLISSFFNSNSSDNIRNFLEEKNFRVVKAFGDIVLFKRNFSAGFKIWEPGDSFDIQNTINANIDNKIRLTGYDSKLEKGLADNGKILHLVYYWEQLNSLDRPIGVIIQFFDTQDNVVYSNFHYFGYRIYAVNQKLPVGKIFKEHHLILLPLQIFSKGDYVARMALFYNDGKQLPILDKNKIDTSGRISLGSISIK